MFARLILALLLAAFALPALANGPCHDAPAMAMPAMHHGSAHLPRPDDRAAPPHVCIGCIPPASLATHVVAAPDAGVRVPYRIVATAFAARGGTPPALPPPRDRA